MTINFFTFFILQVVSFSNFREQIGDIKFSPNGMLLAVGSNDNSIDIYRELHGKSSEVVTDTAPDKETEGEKPSTTKSASTIQPEWKFKFRLQGHSSYITHL